MTETTKLSTYLKLIFTKYRLYFISLFSIAIIASIFNVSVNYKIKELIDTIATDSNANIMQLLALFVLYRFIHSGMFFISRLLDIKYNPMILAEIVSDMYIKTIKHSLHWFDSHLSGEISNKISDFQNNVITLISHCFCALNSLATIAISILFLLNIHIVPVTIIFIFVIVYTPIIVLLLRKQMQLQEQYVSARQKTLGIINDSIANIFSIKIIGNSFTEFKLKLNPAILNWKNWDKKTRQFDAYYVDNADTIMVVIMIAIQIYCPASFYRTGQITGGDFAFVSMITLNIHHDIDNLLEKLLFSINPSIASIKSSFAFINAKYDTPDKQDAKILTNVIGEIQFKNVDFTYGGESVIISDETSLRALEESVAISGGKLVIARNEVPWQSHEEKVKRDCHVANAPRNDDDSVTHRNDGLAPILSNFNLRIKPGQRIGIVGTSGAGKTTIIKCLLRYFDIQAGEILIDGQNIANITQESLRANISVIPQDITMFHRSILENLQFAKYDATFDEIAESCRKARIHEDILNMSNGYDSIVGERGVKLSGGQRQRIAIARAILKNAPILILDEATSALDRPTEKLIQESINEMLQTSKATAIIIAHRLSTLLHLDRILVLNQGKIVEDGSHEELIEKNGLYKTLWDAQTGGFIAIKGNEE